MNSALRPKSGFVPSEKSEPSVLALIRQLEAATEDDNEHDLDNAIASWLYENARVCGALVNYDPPLWLIRNGGWVNSLDAAANLATRILPRWGFDCGQPARMGEHGGRPWADCWPPVEDGEVRAFRLGGPRPTPNHSNAETMPLALCIAILKATTALPADSVGIRAADEQKTETGE